MTLGKSLAWLMFTAMVGIAGQFTDRSAAEVPAKQLLASSPQARRPAAEPDAKRRLQAEQPRVRIERVSAAPLP